jgi:hypothetical protein
MTRGECRAKKRLPPWRMRCSSPQVNLDEIGRAPLPRCVIVVQGRKPHAFPDPLHKSFQIAGRAENEMRLTSWFDTVLE